MVNKWKDYSGDTVVLYNDYLKVVEERDNTNARLERVVESKNITNNKLRNKVKELEEKIKNIPSHLSGFNYIRQDNYLKVVEENEELKRKLNSLKECKVNPLAKFRPVEEWRKENEYLKEKISILEQSFNNVERKKLERQLKDLTSIANCRGEEIEQYKIITKEVIKLTKFISEERNCYGRAGDSSVDVAIDMIKRFEKEIEKMKTLKVCMNCSKIQPQSKLEKIARTKQFFIDNCLKEDCEVCGGNECKDIKEKIEKNSLYGKSKTKFGELIENTSYGFEDSWMLSYKVEGMKDPIIQHHLTKEECEIIYGNMDNITYWFMEVMK